MLLCELVGLVVCTFKLIDPGVLKSTSTVSAIGKSLLNFVVISVDDCPD